MDDLTSNVIDWPLWCKKCGQRGLVGIDGREAIRTSGGFYLKLKHPHDRRRLILCAVCDTIHPYPP